jgi:surfeit locus 1 family protein
MSEGVRPRFPVLLSVCAGLAFMVLCGLGTWQVQRLHWKQGLIDARLAAMAAPPKTLTDASAPPPPAFTRVRMDGAFIPGATFIVGPRSYERDSGWQLIVPFRMRGGGLVLVNRGWIPHAMKATPPDAHFGPSTVVGLVRMPGPRGWLTPENDPMEDVWFTVDPKAMAKRLGLAEPQSWWVDEARGPDPKQPPIGGQGGEMPANNHLQYALTWYGIAAGLVGVYLVLMRRRPTS